MNDCVCSVLLNTHRDAVRNTERAGEAVVRLLLRTMRIGGTLLYIFIIISVWHVFRAVGAIIIIYIHIHVYTYVYIVTQRIKYKMYYAYLYTVQCVVYIILLITYYIGIIVPRHSRVFFAQNID